MRKNRKKLTRRQRQELQHYGFRKESFNALEIAESRVMLFAAIIVCQVGWNVAMAAAYLVWG